MTDSLTRLAVVIPVYNRREITLLGLKSLHAVNRTGLEIKFFVVDDASPDGTYKAVREAFPEVEVIRGTGNLHYAAGTNWGIEAALDWAPDYVVTMNDDAVVHADLFVRLIASARKHPRSIFGALLLLWDKPHEVFQVGGSWHTFKGGFVLPEYRTVFDFPDVPFDVDNLVGNCVLFPVEAILECGLMDAERFPDGWGDAQYTNRMKLSGWRLMIDPKAYVWCEPNTYPSPLHETSVKNVFKSLFVNRRHPVNLWRQFISRWEASPGKVRAVTAYCVYVGKLGIKSLSFITKRVFSTK